MPRIFDLEDLDLAPGDDVTAIYMGVDVPARGRTERITMDQIVNRFILRATGVGTIDTPALIAACAANSVVVIDTSYASLRLDQGESVPLGDTLIMGHNGMANIIIENDTLIYFGNYVGAFYNAAWETATLSADKLTISAAGVTGVVEGDLIFITSDDPISGVSPHFDGGATLPGEFCLVEKVTGTDFQIQTRLYDTYATNIRVYHFPVDGTVGASSANAISPNAGMVDIDFTGSDNQTLQSGILFYSCYRPHVQNIILNGTAAMSFTMCFQGFVDNIKVDGMFNGHFQYGLTVACCDEMLFTNYQGRNTRHHWTTGGFAHSATAGDVNLVRVAGVRVGTNRRNVVKDYWCWCTASESPANSNYALDTHSEGLWTTFINCHVDLSGTQEGSSCGFNNRARKTLIIDCSVIGPGAASGELTTGIQVFGDDCTIINTRVKGVRTGIYTRAVLSAGYTPSNIRILGGDISDVNQNAVLLYGGAGHEIEGVSFGDDIGANCILATVEYGGATDVTGLTVRDSRFPSGAGNSINQGGMDPDNLKIENCQFPGYTTVTDIGMDRTISTTAEIERKASPLCGRPPYGYYTRTAHGLTSGEYGYPIDSEGAIWTDTNLFAGILLDVIDANHFIVAPPGIFVDLPYAMVNDIGTYSPASEGYFLKWNSTSDGYSVAGDGGTADPFLLETLDYTTDGLHARVREASSSDPTPTPAVGVGWNWEDGEVIQREDGTSLEPE